MSADQRRPDYVSTVAGLLKPGTQGPHRFTPEQIRAIFGSQLQVQSVEETVYQGTLDPLPRALFCVLQQKETTP